MSFRGAKEGNRMAIAWKRHHESCLVLNVEDELLDVLEQIRLVATVGSHWSRGCITYDCVGKTETQRS